MEIDENEHLFYLLANVQKNKRDIRIPTYAGESSKNINRCNDHFKGYHSFEALQKIRIPKHSTFREIEKGLFECLRDLIKEYNPYLIDLNKQKNSNSRPTYILNGEYLHKEKPDIGEQMPSSNSFWQDGNFRSFIEHNISQDQIHKEIEIGIDFPQKNNELIFVY
jgi:hypothetical protein